MSNFGHTNDSQSLFLAAQSYISLAYSVIPVYGDSNPEKSKVAAVQWKNYQYRRPKDQDLVQWFQEDCHFGLAIITGRISNLVVLDFDSAQLEQEFTLKFPHLMQTRIVTSAGRNLSHYYYNITNGITIKSTHIEGADILSDGCYVIAPPTIINQKSYKIKRGGMPYTLTPHDAYRIQQFFQQYQSREAENIESPVGAQYIAPLHSNIDRFVETQNTVSADNTTPLKNISSENLIQLYRHYAPLMGRNNTLFKMGAYARDAGWNLPETEFALIDAHVQQTSADGKLESPQKRQHEAQNTLKSVFKRPARQIQQAVSALPTSVREALLKSDQAAVARVLDGLFLKGILAGALLSEKDIKDLLLGIVGRHSILAALKACFADNTPIFVTVDPSPRTPSHTSVACKSSEDINKKCFLFSATESDKNRKGRPARLYLVPDVNVLCAKLAVAFTRSDRMEAQDIQNPKTYRQAVYRELIKRRPGMYSRAWLARRLGISRRTCQRYDEQIKIRRKALYIETMLTWDNLHEILSDEAPDGTCLRDSNGKRYPAKLEIARALMARGLFVTHLQQDHNYYWFGENLPVVSVHYGVHPQQEKIDAQREKMNQYIRDYWENIFQQTPRQVQTIMFPYRKSITQAESEAKKSPLIKQASHKGSKRYYRAPLADGDAENLASRLVMVIHQQAKTKKSRLSHANARRAVEHYGMNKVNQVIEVLQSRQNIQNPAGFAMMYLRSSAQVR